MPGKNRPSLNTPKRLALRFTAQIKRACGECAELPGERRLCPRHSNVVTRMIRG